MSQWFFWYFINILQWCWYWSLTLCTSVMFTIQDTLRDCAHETTTCYNTVVSPIYFVSFVLTAQFVLVNVVIAVLMKHLEESNKEAKEEAEMEAELELESRAQLEDMTPRSPQLNPLAMGLDRLSSGGSPCRSSGEQYREQGDVPMDSPTADISRDSVNIRADPLSCLEPTQEVIHLFMSHPHLQVLNLMQPEM